LFNYNYDKYVYGDIYIGKSAAFTGGYYTPIQYFFDSTHTSYNRTSWGPMNLVVKQSSQGETINYPFNPPNNEYWVATGYQLLTTGQVTLYNVQFPGWSACPKTGANGVTYWQVWLSVSPSLLVLLLCLCIITLGLDGYVLEGVGLMVVILSEFRSWLHCYSIVCH